MSVAVGGLAGALAHRVAKHSPWPAVVSAASLVAAAVTYRVADLRADAGPARSRELSAVGVTAAVGLASALVPAKTGYKLLAAGWLSHAVFDAAHHRNSSSQLPGWYPAVCAGFDAVVAAQLLRDASE